MTTKLESEINRLREANDNCGIGHGGAPNFGGCPACGPRYADMKYLESLRGD